MLKLSVWGRKVVKIINPKNDNKQEISLFDVKELYDLAYAEKNKAKGCLKVFTRLLEQASELEQKYWQQQAMAEMNEFRAKAHKRAGAK